jgi:nicotianamine synthase
MNQHQIIIKNLSGIAEQLRQLDDFSPRPQVNNLLSQLVHIVDQTNTEVAARVMADPLVSGHVPFFQEISARSESALEKYWSSYIASAVEPSVVLREFTYFSNYELMTKDEVALLKKYGLDINKRALFIGGGALPLTAILMAIEHGYQVDCLDNDEETCLLAEKLIQSLGLSNSVRIINVDSNDFANYSDYQIVIVAALVGISDKEKMQVIRQIKREIKSDSYVLLRSVEALGNLLYRQVSEEHLAEMSVIHRGLKNSDYINTLILGKFSHG